MSLTDIFDKIDDDYRRIRLGGQRTVDDTTRLYRAIDNPGGAGGGRNSPIWGQNTIPPTNTAPVVRPTISWTQYKITQPFTATHIKNKNTRQMKRGMSVFARSQYDNLSRLVLATKSGHELDTSKIEKI